jgi:pimeloyl-ACP methyl ester carboxylesterase
MIYSRRVKLALVLLVACSSPSKPAPYEPGATGCVPSFGADEVYAVKREEVWFTAEGRRVPGTIARPAEAGLWPGVLILAGSGPTDRNWNSPLLPGTNGSAALLADDLAMRGAMVLRFDKAGSGKNPAPANLTLDTYREEARAALAYLHALPAVYNHHVFVIGHSEGGLHATRLAAVVDRPLDGIIYLSSASRTMSDTLLGQLEAQLRNPAAMLSDKAVEQELDGVRRMLADFVAGKPVDPMQASRIPALQQFLAGVVAPATAPVMRELLAFDTAVEAAKLAGPFYVAAGGKDLQVDPELDGKRLEKSLLDAGKDVTFHVSPDADHVLKHEPRTLQQARDEMGKTHAGYNAAGRVLDNDFRRALTRWIATRVP